MSRLFVPVGRTVEPPVPEDIVWKAWGETRVSFDQLTTRGVTFGELDYPYAEGLVADYRFNEGAGSVLTDYAGGHEGQILGPIWTPNGLQFDGVDDLVRILDSPDLNFATELTLITVITPASWDATKHERIIDKGAYSPPWNGYALLTSSNNTNIMGRICVDNEGTYRDVFTGVTLSTGEVHVLAFTVKSGEQVVYDNGVAIGSTGHVFSQIDPGPEDVGFGHRANMGSNQVFTGEMHYALFFNRALSEAEVVENYRWLRDNVLAERGILLP